MSSNKRYREDEDIQIRVATGEPLAADSFVLRAHSTCARALPADAAVWDVSGLLYEGQPFSRETVVCWLQCVCFAVHGDDEQLQPDSINQLSTARGLAQVLSFAHAVGSFKGVCQAACSQLPQLKFVVQLPERVLELPLGGWSYFFRDRTLMQYDLHATEQVGSPLASVEQVSVVRQQAAKQAAALLQLGHMLHLQPLHDVLRQFILRNGQPMSSISLLSGVMGLVFTDAVLEAAVGSNSTLGREAYINSILSQPCSLTPGAAGHSSMLQHVEEPAYNSYSKTLSFCAQLRRDFAGRKAGDKVKVILDLFGDEHQAGIITFSNEHGEMYSEDPSVTLPVQLLLGSTFSQGAALDTFLKPPSA